MAEMSSVIVSLALATLKLWLRTPAILGNGRWGQRVLHSTEAVVLDLLELVSHLIKLGADDSCCLLKARVADDMPVCKLQVNLEERLNSPVVLQPERCLRMVQHSNRETCAQSHEAPNRDRHVKEPSKQSVESPSHVRVTPFMNACDVVFIHTTEKWERQTDLQYR